MKPVSVINRGESFVTLRATTDRPEEIQEALATRDVQHVFKGDQNQAWDAVLANHCLARAVGSDDVALTFFIQDERLGTADVRLARSWRREGREYALTEDYYRGRTGAVWEHQDISHGLLFTEAVAPEQFAHAAIDLHRAAHLWERHHPALLADREWTLALTQLGISVSQPNGQQDLPTADATTGLGPSVNSETLHALFQSDPAAWLYYAFTKTDGLYGLVPVENSNITLSSIPATHPEIQRGGAWLLRTAARGAMRLAVNATHRHGIKLRARQLGEWAGEYFRRHPDASVTDFQVALGQHLTAEVFPADRLQLDRTSRFTSLTVEELPSLSQPKKTLYFFFDLALRHPREFTEAYNEALNRVGFGLQRMKYDPLTGYYTPPFFVEFSPEGPGTPMYRFGIELHGADNTTIRLTNPTLGDLSVSASEPVRSVEAFARALFEGLNEPHELALVGKAATFAAELQRSPRGLGLPRQGSKYTPMVDHLVSGLRDRGVLDESTGLLIRIGLNALDRLEAMGELELRLPKFLVDVMGRQVTCREFASRWRDVAAEAHGLLQALSHSHVGQHVHLARLICVNARGLDLSEATATYPRLDKLVRQLQAAPVDPDAIRELGADVPESVVACLERLLSERTRLLEERRELVRASQAQYEGGRLVPNPERMAQLQQERERIETALLLLVAAYVRRLWQRAESLGYVNDRPYTLALYLLFGRDIFAPICRQVEFDIEYISPCPVSRVARAPIRSE